MAKISLPIDPILPEAIAILNDKPNLVIQATPGSGKTTRLPPALLAAKFLKPIHEVLVLEPRRLAAKYAAHRVSEEMGEPIGKTIGYQFRFEKVDSKTTRLRFLTEGMLMRRLLSDRALEGVGAVVLDEFHERHLHGDLALSYLRHLQRTDRTDLRLVVMSATLDTSAVTTFLDPCPLIQLESRLFPIETVYLERSSEKPLEQLVKDAAREELAKGKGHILVFLPGIYEIRKAQGALETLRLTEEFIIHVLHGELPREVQDRAIQGSLQRKIILSTNVAETSLTIEGVDSVIDSGLHRMASYSWWSGVPSLRTRPISRASAAQRAGRAGRTGPGRCRRLFTKADFEGRAQFDPPEIRRADLAQTYLELQALGIKSPDSFPWFEAPSPQALDAARALLIRLGALEGVGLSEIGKKLVKIPAHPRLGRMLLEAHDRLVLPQAANLAAVIAEGRLERLDALAHSALDETARRTRDQFLSAFPKQGHSGPIEASKDTLAFCVLTGFPDRVARKRRLDSSINRTRGHEVEMVLSSGGAAIVEETGVISEGDTFVALDIQEQQGGSQSRSRIRLRSVCLIQPEWLFDLLPSAVKDVDCVEWDVQKKAVVNLAQMTYDELVLSESQTEPKPSELTTQLLLKAGLGLDFSRTPAPSAAQWIDTLSKLCDREGLESAMGRVMLISQNRPNWGIMLLDPKQLTARLMELMLGKFSLAALKAINWPETLFEYLCGPRLGQISNLLPLTFTLPNGRKTKINYAPAKSPWLESRLQDFFGMSQGPALLEGSIPLTLHLLAPNRRAVQVTSDLAGFWKRTYPEVRKELSRKYPRQFWPENPLLVPIKK